MARKAVKTDVIPGKQRIRDRAQRRRGRITAQANVATLKNTKFEDLTPEQKDELLKVLMLRAGLILPD